MSPLAVLLLIQVLQLQLMFVLLLVLQVYIGVIPDAGLTQTFAELKPRGLGLFLALTGERLRAADLMDTGSVRLQPVLLLLLQFPLILLPPSLTPLLLL